MEDKYTSFRKTLENALIKAVLGVLITAMALPTAWQWSTAFDTDGIIGVTIALITLGSIALLPLAIGCLFAFDDLHKARRIWRTLQTSSRPRNQRIG